MFERAPMTPEEFIQFCKMVKQSDNTGGAGQAKTYFTAVYIGYEYPNLGVPDGDLAALEGYDLGLRLRERNL